MSSTASSATGNGECSPIATLCLPSRIARVLHQPVISRRRNFTLPCMLFCLPICMLQQTVLSEVSDLCALTCHVANSLLTECIRCSLVNR